MRTFREKDQEFETGEKRPAGPAISHGPISARTEKYATSGGEGNTLSHRPLTHLLFRRHLPTMNFTSAKLGGLVLALLMVLGGCGNGQPSSAPTGTIPEATFVAAMAELHHALGSALDGELSQATQDEILARHGIKAEDLLAFAEVHGTDIPTMLRIWQDVARESRLLDAPDAADDSGMLP